MVLFLRHLSTIINLNKINEKIQRGEQAIWPEGTRVVPSQNLPENENVFSRRKEPTKKWNERNARSWDKRQN